MNRWQKLGAGMALVALLSVSQPAAAQAFWPLEVYRLYDAYQDGRLVEELIWIGVGKAGEAILGGSLTPDPVTPYTFDLDGHTYTLTAEEAKKMEVGRAYPLASCPEGFASLFSARDPDAGPCVSGGSPDPNPAYTITRNYNLIGGNSFTVERQTP